MTKFGTYDDVKAAKNYLMRFTGWFSLTETDEHVIILDATDGTPAFKAMRTGLNVELNEYNWICWYNPVHWEDETMA